MEMNMDNILVFKTNISSQAHKEKAKDILDAIDHIEEWSIDMEDIDRVLRVVSRDPDSNEIIHKLTNAGYECSELD
jgi:tRNA G26 N,N-dimethylase Trm1